MPKSIKKDNRGATIVMVLVTMAFLSILGATVLFTSYTNLTMKVSERKGTQNFYSAEAALDDIRIGLQQITSDAISKAYTSVLADYNTSSSNDDAFRDFFSDALKAWKDADGDQLFFAYGGTDFYDPDVLEKFLTNPTNVTISGAGDVEITESNISICGLEVSYLENGYETTIGTDIRISFPSFTYTLSELILTAVPAFTIIAKDELLQNSGGAIEVAGHAYAGNITVIGGGNIMKVGTADNFICKGRLNIANGAGFTTDPASSLWANRIELTGSDSHADLKGDTYVADDLELAGTNSKATLTGRYFGFGNSLSVAGQSSSIIVSGKNTTLQLENAGSRLRNLMLAGNSFITTGSENAVLMGESISVKSNQLAYLIPSQCIGTVSSNPAIFPSASVPSASTLRGYVNQSYVLWGGVPLSDYIDDVKLAIYPMGSNTLVYFYMQFDTVEKANKYFADYFSRNKSEIEKYLDVYSELMTVNSMIPRITSGGVAIFDGNNAGILPASTVVSSSTPTRLSNMFRNLCSTLSTTIEGSGSTSVYEYIVDEDAVAALSGTTTFTNAAGEIVALIVDGNYTLNSGSPGTLRVVVATGDVTVSRNFTGLIISGGTVSTAHSMYASHNEVSAAFQATAPIGGEDVTLLNFLKITTGSASQPASGGSGVSWDLERLVTYSNWTKN